MQLVLCMATPERGSHEMDENAKKGRTVIYSGAVQLLRNALGGVGQV